MQRISVYLNGSFITHKADKKAKKTRLDHLLTQSLLEDCVKAQRVIMAGLVYVNGQKCDKPGTLVRADAEIEVRETPAFVSRGGLKLKKALDVFSLDATETVCLDVGASTGGFTDCLLQHGAIKVYAVDVGHGQLHYRLQQDKRVINLERTHIRVLTHTHIPEAVDVLVVDTSFISLQNVLPLAWPFLCTDGWAVALIKPQFEVERIHLSKGVVRDEAVRQAVVDQLCVQAKQLPGVQFKGVIESPIRGPKGNVEYLMLLIKTQSSLPQTAQDILTTKTRRKTG